MRISSQLLLNFLLNAAWQIALIAALASLGAWLLRASAARYRHWLWVGAFCLALLLPATTSITAYFEVTAPPRTIEPAFVAEPFQFQSVGETTNATRDLLPSVIPLNTDLALILLGIYVVFVLYR